MTVYSYAELERLWIDAGGPAGEAPLAAAIAEAESGGNSSAYNGHDTNGQGGTQVSAGLWQISNGTMTPVAGWSNPATNARDAVAKYHGAGNTFEPWGTYTSGAYKAFLSGKTTPASSVPGAPDAPAAATATAASADCLIGNPFSASVPLVGTISAGPACLFSRSNARAFIGAGLVLAGAAVALTGLVLGAAVLGYKAAGPAGKVAETTGGALLLVPGAEAAGGALTAGGAAARSPARAGKQRQARLVREEKEHRAAVGEPRENRNMEPRGGTVRENRRQTAARRSRERRRVQPATREEAGF